MWGISAHTEQSTKRFYCSECKTDEAPKSVTFAQRGHYGLKCSKCHVHSSNQRVVLSSYARIQAPSLEDFKSWATSTSSQNIYGTWSLEIPQVSSSSGSKLSRSENRLPMPSNMHAAACAKLLIEQLHSFIAALEQPIALLGTFAARPKPFWCLNKREGWSLKRDGSVRRWLMSLVNEQLDVSITLP